MCPAFPHSDPFSFPQFYLASLAQAASPGSYLRDCTSPINVLPVSTLPGTASGPRKKISFPGNGQNKRLQAELTTLLRASESFPLNLDEIRSPSVTYEAL